MKIPTRIPLSRNADEQRVVDYAVAFWLRRGMTQWPSIAEIARGLKRSRGAIRDIVEGTHIFMLTSFGPVATNPDDNVFVEVQGDGRVEAAMKSYWREENAAAAA